MQLPSPKSNNGLKQDRQIKYSPGSVSLSDIMAIAQERRNVMVWPKKILDAIEQLECDEAIQT
jgi:hypothetical protein